MTMQRFEKIQLQVIETVLMKSVKREIYKCSQGSVFNTEIQVAETLKI